MSKQTQKSHRHFVAAPLLLIAVGYSILQAELAPATASLLPVSVVQTAVGEAHRLPGDLNAIVYSGEGFAGSDNQAELLGGSALLQTDGLSELAVGEYRLQAADGAFHVSYHNGELTVAALDAPVYVLRGGRQMLVPAGLQWKHGVRPLQPLAEGGAAWLRDRALQPLPRHFVQEQLTNLSHLPGDTLNLPSAREELPAPLWLQMPGLRFAEARDRVESAWADKVLGVLRHRVETGDAVGTEELLHSMEYAEIMQSKRAHYVVAALLGNESPESALSTTLLTYLTTDPAVWMLYAFHPDWRDSVWTMFGPDADSELTLLRLFLLPQSDVDTEAISVLTWQRWSEEVTHKSREMKEATAFLDQMFQLTVPLVSRADSRGYPERARRLAASLKSIADELEPVVSAASAELLRDLGSLGRTEAPVYEPEPVPEPAAEAAAVSVAEPETPAEETAYSPDMVEARSYSMLRDMGAMFTVQTVIAAEEPNIATVRGVLFSTNAGDLQFDMKINVATGQITDIIQEDKVYPYALTVEQFSAWIQG